MEHTGIKPKVIEEIRTFARKYNIDKVILFGSRARGDYRRTSDIDLAVVDIMMPGMDGFELVEQMRQYREFPVIMLTAKSQSKDKLRGFSLGIDGAHTSTVKAVSRYDKGYKVESTLPLVEVAIALDDPVTYLKTYAMRCEKMIDGKRYAQYFIKKFNYVAVTSQDVSGSQLTDYPELFLKDARIDVETVVELDLVVDPIDGRGWFQRTSNAMDRYFNAVILWLGNKCKVEVNIDGVQTQLGEYRNIIASNRTHRRDLPLERGGKITSYSYLLYFI